MGKKHLALNPASDSDRAASTASVAPLIATKIRVPRRRSDLLPRERLVEYIHMHLGHRLILISAPAGFGKTSLLADFAHDCDLPVCWYTLDRFDRDFRVFLESFIAAISRRFPAFGGRSLALLREVQDPGRELYPLVATLVQELHDAIPEYFVLILDDHHTVQDQDQIGEFLDLLLTYTDENLHLILASRELPALPSLALLVARRQAAGLSIDELRFTAQEIQALARQNYGRDLTESQAERLAERTGGWITGLLLTAAPRWEQAPGAEGQPPIRSQINVNLYDYLSQQVLDQQPANLRDFLLASSVLDELSPALCTKVLGIERPAELLAQLRTRNLFVTEFEGDDDRLRYHDLFHEFLQTTLRRQDQGRFRELARRAAEVYAARGEWERAVSRYLELREYEPVAGIVERTATALFESGRWDTLVAWIDALPREMLDRRPRFLIQRAKICSSRGDQAQAMLLFERAEQAFDSVGDRAGVASAKALKGYVLSYQGRYTEAVAHAREALALIRGETEQEKLILALAQKNIGYSQIRLGQLAEGQEAFRHALSLYESCGDLHGAGLVYHDLGLSDDLAGNLDGAVSHYQAALERWQKLGNLGPWANTLNGLGVVYHLQGRYDEAMDALQQALAKARQIGYLRVEALAWASLGDLYRDLMRYQHAQEAYAEALRTATRAGEGFVVTYALAAQGDVARRQGDLGRARELLKEAMGHAEAHGSTYETDLCHVALGVLAGEERDRTAARYHFDQAVKGFKAGGFKRDLVRACLFRAQVAFLAGEQAEAFVDLGRALALADELGVDQFLIAEGYQMQSLLRQAAEQGVGGEAVPLLLQRIKKHLAQVASREPTGLSIEPTAQPQPAAPTFKIYALGFPQVELNGEVVQWPVTQSRDLFFCLLQFPQGLRKEQLGELFWPEHEPHRLHNIFRSTLYRLRRALSSQSVVFADERYCFNRDMDHWYDVEVFERLLAQAKQEKRIGQRIALLQEALALYRGDYLAGIYADWLIVERERLRARFLEAMEALAELYTERGSLRQAVELYQCLLTHDPYRELAHRGLMTCYHQLGDRAAAIGQYRRCVELLREELGLSPMVETEALYLQIIS